LSGLSRGLWCGSYPYFHLVQVKRNPLESPILYKALIGRPEANKSHLPSFTSQPVIEHDYCQNQEYQKLYAEYERAMSMKQKRNAWRPVWISFCRHPPQTLSCFGKSIAQIAGERNYQDLVYKANNPSLRSSRHNNNALQD
jgi:hypothetical protein